MHLSRIIGVTGQQAGRTVVDGNGLTKTKQYSLL